MSTLKAWVQASRLPSQSYIFFPLLLGQAVHYAQTGQFSAAIFVLLHLYGLFLQLFIVYANDRADIETDRLNTTYTMFSGGSRTLVTGLISLRENSTAILTVIMCNAAVGLTLTALFQRSLALPFISVSLGLLWMYSFPPMRLSYRGAGELLQMLGVGLVLPVFGYYGQAGTLNGFPLQLLTFILPCQLACAMATALPDEPSDRASCKRTAPVLLGLSTVKLTIIGLIGASLGFFFLFSPAMMSATAAILLIPAACFTGMIALRRASPPGSQRMGLFVSCAVGANIVLMAGAALLFFNLH
jgi:1,4-dihydroxy-2-naphthoate octaprenyltransferase